MAHGHPNLECCSLLPCQCLASYHNIPTTMPHSHHHHQTHTDDDAGDEGGMTKVMKQVRTKKQRCVHPHLHYSQPTNDLRTTHRRISATKAADDAAKGDPEDFTTYIPLHLCFNPDTDQKKKHRGAMTCTTTSLVSTTTTTTTSLVSTTMTTASTNNCHDNCKHCMVEMEQQDDEEAGSRLTQDGRAIPAVSTPSAYLPPAPPTHTIADDYQQRHP